MTRRRGSHGRPMPDWLEAIRRDLIARPLGPARLRGGIQVALQDMRRGR